MPQIIGRYERLFASVYDLMYAIEPAVVRGEKIQFDIEVLREYYDVLKKYFKSYRMYDLGKSLRNLFENYESGLRRMIIEREY